MTIEQPDTAAIRAMLWTGLDVETALELCDALDATRAERDRHLADSMLAQNQRIAQAARAEAAEARAESNHHMCGRRASGLWNCRYRGCCVDGTCCSCCFYADERIAAALAVLRNRDVHCRDTIEDAIRALTEGTGQ